jgi:hypothetical protein
VDTTLIFTAPWPYDLAPATVPFMKRTVTVLERQGIYTNRTLLTELTATDVFGWWNAGPAQFGEWAGGTFYEEEENIPSPLAFQVDTKGKDASVTLFVDLP